MKLQEAYEAMHGNYDDVMGRLPREESVIKFLKKFMGNTDFQQMVTAAEENNFQEVFKASHSLKGMCGNLGITGLEQIVSKICELVRHGDPAEDLAPYIMQAREEYATVLTIIGQL